MGCSGHRSPDPDDPRDRHRHGATGGAALNFQEMIGHASQTGGPALCAMGFQDRARILNAPLTQLNALNDRLMHSAH